MNLMVDEIFMIQLSGDGDENDSYLSVSQHIKHLN
jgi:hypothetical protein